MDVTVHVEAKARAAKEASRVLALAPTRTKNDALYQMARGLEEKAGTVLDANRADLERARSAGLNRAFLDRLALTDGRLEEMASGLRQVAALPDPVGETVEVWRRPSGLEIARIRVPLGVVGFIYESRPNVTADAAGLCLKSGNACILRGGSEAVQSNQAIAACVHEGLRAAGLPDDTVQLIATTDRAAVGLLVTMDCYVDVLVPRGGKSLIRRVADEASVPVLKHLDGVCHVFIDEHADVAMAIRIADNAKTQRYSPCNTMETLLVHAKIAPLVLPPLCRIYADKGVE